jgi:hypothetical protein
MTIEQIIGEALLLPPNAIAYHVSRRLTALLPDKGVVETKDNDFDVEEYAAAGLCTLTTKPDTHPQLVARWDGRTNTRAETIDHGWFEVTWQGRRLDVLMIEWRDMYCSTEFAWVLADERATAEHFFDAVCAWNSAVRDEVLVFDGGYWSKKRSLFREIKNATLDNLVLRGALKSDLLSDLRHFFDSREMYDSYGIPWKRGVILIGPPGNGKTHAVKALINALEQPCLYVKSFRSQHATDDDNIRQVFQRARESAPCILVLEDLDALVNPGNRSFFLNELDGFAENRGILTLATTNHPERLDPAILDRPSRFDRKYHFELPGIAERQAYLQLWNASLKPDLRLSDTGIETIAAQTDEFSFAYLKELLLTSMMGWLATPEPGTMDNIMLTHIPTLREQMSSALIEPPPDNDGHQPRGPHIIYQMGGGSRRSRRHDD